MIFFTCFLEVIKKTLNLQESKSELDIQAAVKMPPMPGQSRSLLQFDPIEHNDIADLADFEVGGALVKIMCMDTYYTTT